MFAVDCHPWNGMLGLSLLTKGEAEENHFLFDPEEMAAWRFFQFSKSDPSWGSAKALAEHMRMDYECSGDKTGLAEKYFDACVETIRDPLVKLEIRKLNITEDFKVSVANPDSGKEYFL